MDYRRVVSILLLALITGCASREAGQTNLKAPQGGPVASYNVRDYGAAGDGVAKDTAAFQKALDASAVNGGGEVVVPAGRYLIGSIQMGTATILRLEKESVLVGSPDASDYPTMDIRWEGRWQPGRRALIYLANVDHTGIVGPGRIEGNAAMAAAQNPRGSVVIEPISCNDVRWEDFTVTQGGNWATHPTYCTNVVIKNLNIRGNRDGIDVDSCKNVRIEGCTIDTGDDCISLKSGRGLNGARVGKAVEDVVITQCTLRGRTFACLGIGSEISAGVKNIRIDHCKMTAGSQAIYLKTRVGRAGVSENIVGDELDILAGSFLRINLVNGGNTNTSDDPVEGLVGIPSARKLSFSNIRLNNASSVADVNLVNPEKPVEGLTLANISGTAQKGITLVNVKDAVLKNIQVTGVNGPLLSTSNTTGTGLEGAVPYTPPPARTGGPAVPGRGGQGARGGGGGGVPATNR